MSGYILLTWIALYLITSSSHVSSRSLTNEKDNFDLKEITNQLTTESEKQEEINSTNENVKHYPKYYCEEKHALINKTRLWPNKTVYYNITKHDFNEEEIETINKAINNLNQLSCVTLKPIGNEQVHHLTIQRGTSCSAQVGYSKYKQELNLSKFCFDYGTILHELLHTIGFRHMHLTYDRDDYIEILWDNVEPDFKSAFNKLSPLEVTNLGLPYDYGSIMHYPANAFGIKGATTMVAKLPTNETMGQNEGLSKLDIMRLNKLYECPGY